MWEILRIEITGEGCSTLPRVKFCLPTLRFLVGAHRGEKLKFLSRKNENPIFHDTGRTFGQRLVFAGMPKFLIVLRMWYIWYCYCIAGHSLGA